VGDLLVVPGVGPSQRAGFAASTPATLANGCRCLPSPASFGSQ
jgi:hypothetical protein